MPTTAVYSGQTVSLGGPAVTVTNLVSGTVSTTTQVVSLGAGGFVIVNLDTGVTITSAYGNAVPTTAVYGGQTLSLGGPAVTITNVASVSSDAASQTRAANDLVSGATTNQIVSLGAGGLVIVNLDTGITITSVYGTTVPTTAVYDGQTLALGGSAVTITNTAESDKSSSSANVSTSSSITATTTTASRSSHTNASSVSSSHTDTTSTTHTTSSGNTSIATSTTAPDSSANKISGGFVGLLLTLMASIWV